jgi:hypothetical protein
VCHENWLVDRLSKFIQFIQRAAGVFIPFVGSVAAGSHVPISDITEIPLETRPAVCLAGGMLTRVARLFVIKSRFDACVIIYALALGALMRGSAYLQIYPDLRGALLFSACLGAVFMAGAKLLEVTRLPPAPLHRRRWSD